MKSGSRDVVKAVQIVEFVQIEGDFNERLVLRSSQSEAGSVLTFNVITPSVRGF